MTRRYQIFDVFTETPLAGNALAVVLDAEGLDDTAMQAIAREFNLSETVFVLPAENPAHSARLRIFTPGLELPFAGHPTVGTAVCLALERLGGEGDVDSLLVLEEGVGPVRCGVKIARNAGFAEFDCPQLPVRAGEAAPKELLAAALGVEPAELGFENHQPTLWSAGVPFHFVPVASMAVLARAAPQRPNWQPALAREEPSSIRARRKVTGIPSGRACLRRSWASRRIPRLARRWRRSPARCATSTISPTASI
jgi:trans-2,3-dihydro-3-hydroxyanthranilate isomerase